MVRNEENTIGIGSQAFRTLNIGRLLDCSVEKVTNILQT